MTEENRMLTEYTAKALADEDLDSVAGGESYTLNVSNNTGNDTPCFLFQSPPAGATSPYSLAWFSGNQGLGQGASIDWTVEYALTWNGSTFDIGPSK